MAQILFFGGSSIQGVGDSEGGWVDRFKRDVHAKMYGPEKDGSAMHSVYNLGILGNATSDVFARVQSELPARAWPGQQFVVVLSVGANDSKAIDAPTNYISNREEFKANLVNVIELVKTYTPYIMLVGLTPIDDLRTRPTANNSYFTQARIHEFDAAMSEVAHETHVEKVELYQSMMVLDWRAMLYEDGQHLNAMGHEWLYLRVREPLQKMLHDIHQN
jgi:lysophospholipase L1-like esterase